MAKKQLIALGRKTFKEHVKIIMEGPETVETIRKAREYMKTVRSANCHTKQEEKWFDIGFLHGTQQNARDFENWNRGFWDGVEGAKHDDIDLFSESKIPKA